VTPKKAPRRSIDASLEWLRAVIKIEDDQRKREREDLRFQSAEDAWDDDVKKARGPRQISVAGKTYDLPAQPMISIASLDEPIGLISAQERSASISPRIHALTEDAQDDTAEILQGIYRAIERDSRGKLARRWGYDRTLWAGRGVYRVLKVYDPEGGHPFDQKLVLRRILYQDSVYLDPFAEEPDWSDGTRAMVVSDLPWPVYKRKYKNSTLAKATAEQLTDYSNQHIDWVKKGEESDETTTIRVAEEWVVEIDEHKMVLLDDNTTAYEDDIPEGKHAKTGDEYRCRVEETRRVYCRVINCVEELEPEQEWDGQYIPLIPTIGRELQPVNGKRQWFGVATNAKGAVRLANYSASSAVQMAAMEPRAPYTWDPRQIESYEKFWETSNTVNWAGLPYHADIDGRPMEAPKRTQVDVGRLGPSMQLFQMSRGLIQTATATHPPALGEDTPAFRSGKAINALQSQSIMANSPYLGNLADISMTYEALVILDLIPHVYDRPGRIARILARDGKTSSLVAVNAPFQPNSNGRPQLLPYDTPEQQQQTDALVADKQHPAKHYDLNKGRYGVEVTIGKSYADERQEGATEMGLILQADPQMMMVIGPEYFDYRGEPWAHHVADLLRKQRKHTMPWLDDDQQQPSAAQMQHLMAENQELKKVLQQAAMEKQAKIVEHTIDGQTKFAVAKMQEDAETRRAAADREVKIAVAELQAKVKDLELFYEERARLGIQAHETATAAAGSAHETHLSQLEHQQALEQGRQQTVADAALSEQTHAQNSEAAEVEASRPESNNGSGA
jgi:hypothetical protein